MLLKCCTQYASKFGKFSSSHGTEKGHILFQLQSKALPENVQTTIQLCWFDMLASWCSKSFKLGFNSTWRKGRGIRNQIASIHWNIGTASKFQKKHLLLLLWYAEAFDCVDHNKLWKILKEMEIPDHLTCLLRNRYVSQEATIKTRHGTTDWSKLWKEYVKAVYYHLTYF